MSVGEECILMMHISIYNWGAVFRVPGSKPGISQGVAGAKNDFLPVPVSRTLSGCHEAVPRGLPSSILIGFGLYQRPAELLKTWIPSSTSLKH